MKHFVKPVAACVTLLMGGTALAQSLVQETPTNVPGVSIVSPPPQTLNMQGASTQTLSQYAVPPRPNPANAPEAYVKWQNAMSGIQNRETPQLQTTNITNGPARKMGNMNQIPNTEASVTTTTNNWSGISIISGTFSTTQAIIGEFVVPTARQAFGSCVDMVYSSNWPGIDGNGSSDVLQAGTESDAACNGGNVTTFYSAWVEWFPNNETRVSSPAIAPGDLMFIEVWSVSATEGYAYLLNYSTNISAQYHLLAPSGTVLKANSIEWIVERPGINGTLANLTNYIHSSWPYGVSWNYQASNPTYYYMGTDPTVGTLQLITMLDSAGKGISAPIVENSDFLWFENYGSSCGASTSPPC